MAYRPFIPRDRKRLRFSDKPRRKAPPRWLWLAGSVVMLIAAFAFWPGGEDTIPGEGSKTARTSQALDLPARGDSAEGDTSGTSETARDGARETAATGRSGADFGGSAAGKQTGPAPPRREWDTVEIRPGDTLAAIFSRQGLGPATVHGVVYLNEDTARLRDLSPGEELRIALDEDGDLDALQFELDEARLVEVRDTDDGLESEVIDRPIETRIVQASGVIDDSLYLSARRAGMSDPLIMDLAHVFAWDIDFVYDIRQGDRFFLVYEELYRDGEKLRDGNVLAASFINRGERLTAVRYEPDGGMPEYFTPDGRNMRKEFLRTPVDFRRISSRFNPNRLHPKLGYRRPHRGVDYAADSGTPVISTGHGRVVKAGWNGGYGNSVIIEHAGRYSTLYAHLSKFAKGVRSGERVRQGQTIGYVGMTGLATGPHLHYEFRTDGSHKDPLKVDFPPAPPLPDREKAEFAETANPLVARLDAMQAETMIAARED